MKKFKVIYHNGDGKRVFKVDAKDDKMAYIAFRQVFGPKVKVLGIKLDIVSKRKKEQRKRIAICATILLITFILGIIIGCIIATRPAPVEYSPYTVKNGDTIWGIATLSDGWNRFDNSYIVEDIMQASKCDAMIHPGQIVLIPNYNY